MQRSWLMVNAKLNHSDQLTKSKLDRTKADYDKAVKDLFPTPA